MNAVFNSCRNMILFSLLFLCSCYSNYEYKFAIGIKSDPYRIIERTMLENGYDPESGCRGDGVCRSRLLAFNADNQFRLIVSFFESQDSVIAMNVRHEVYFHGEPRPGYGSFFRKETDLFAKKLQENFRVSNAMLTKIVPDENKMKRLPPPPVQEKSAEERIRQLQDLHDKGLVTDAEYEEQKGRILKGL